MCYEGNDVHVSPNITQSSDDHHRETLSVDRQRETHGNLQATHLTCSCWPSLPPCCVVRCLKTRTCYSPVIWQIYGTYTKHFPFCTQTLRYALWNKKFQCNCLFFFVLGGWPRGIKNGIKWSSRNSNLFHFLFHFDEMGPKTKIETRLLCIERCTCSVTTRPAPRLTIIPTRATQCMWGV